MHYIGLITSVILLMISSTTHAFSRIPLVDNQPVADEFCPFTNNMSPTTSYKQDGSLDAREFYCVDDNVNIVWSITIPEGCDSGGCGLILDMHGAGMNANTQNYGTKMRELGSDAEAFGASTPYIIAQPSMTDLIDDQTGGIDLDSLLPLQDNRAYVNELPHINNIMQDLISTFDVDTSRIHWYGFSRGSHTISHVLCGDFNLDFPIASYAFAGGEIKCDLPANTPILMINGLTDTLTSDKMAFQDNAEAFMRTIPNIQEETLYEDDNWEQQQGFLFFKVGQHIHKRFSNEDYIFESIRHSAQSVPMFGHCHPVIGYERWLACRANFDIGEKMLQFFIDNSDN